MKSILKTMIATFGLVTFMGTSQVFAQMSSNTTQTKSTAPYAVPPAAHPAGKDNLTFLVGASYTFWQPFQAGTNIAYGKGILTNPSTEAGNIYTPEFNAQSGFKVCLGANVDHDGWNISAEYTWFYNNPGMRTNNLPTDAGDIFAKFQLNSDLQITGLQSMYKNQFNRIDAVLDRAFYAGHYLSLTPFIGLLGTWDMQYLNFDVETTGGPTITYTANTQSTRSNQSWWGIGPYAGINSSYFFTNEWAIFLNSGLSMLLANHKTSQKQYDYDLSNNIAAYMYNTNANINGVEPMLEGALGLSWDSYWPEWAVHVKVSWELQTYFAHSRFDTNVLENYSMQGLTIDLGVSF
jgi:hypothetical protein